MNSQIVKPEDYLKSTRKEVVLPSGHTFQIKKLTARDYMRMPTANFPITNTEQVNDKNTDEKAKEQWLKMTDEQRKASIEFNELFIVAGTVSPKITKDRTEGALCIDDIESDDFNALISAISEFSTERRQDLKPFRTEPEAVVAGYDSEAVQGTTDTITSTINLGVEHKLAMP